MEELQNIAFQIITIIGRAKSLYMEAISLAKDNHPTEAGEKIKAGNEALVEAHNEHFGLIQKEAEGEQLPFSILFMHSEDQMISAEIMRDMAQQLITVYEELNKLREEKQNGGK